MLRQCPGGLTLLMTETVSNLRYLWEMLRSPQRTGSVAQSGPALAKAMAQAVDLTRPGPIIELGPGPGAITQALLDRGIRQSQLLLIEANPVFVRHLRRRFPMVNVVEGDAWHVREILMEQTGERGCASVVSGLPLLNFPLERRHELLSTILDLVARREGAFVQFSYGWSAPIAASPRVRVSRSRWIIRNIPPARVWTYRNP